MSNRFRHLEVRSQERTGAQEQAAQGTQIRTAEQDLGAAIAAYRLGRFENALQLYTRALGLNRAMVPAWVGQVQMLVQLAEYAEARLWSDKALELFKNNGELLAGKAQACVRMNDHRAAMACSDASLQSPGSSPARWQVRGEALLSRDQTRARDCFEKSFAEVGADWFDRVIVARIYSFHDKPTAALDFAQAAVNLGPSHPYAWLVLGNCQDALGWSSQAQTSYARSLEVMPGYSEARSALSALTSQSGMGRFWRRLGGAFRR